MEHVLDVLPFRNTEVMVRVPGSVVREALEHSVSDYSVGDPKGRYLQFSGLDLLVFRKVLLACIKLYGIS